MANQATGRACALVWMRTACGVATGLLVFTPNLAWGATHTYPGVAPCNGTLQACIDGVSAGERIEIASNAPIAEALSIAKSLTLAAAPGYRPQLGGELSPRDTRPLQVAVKEAAGGAATTVTFSQLTFDADITVDFGSGTGHSFVFDRSTVERHPANLDAEEALFPGTTARDFTDNALLSITSSVPANVRVSDSTFIASGGNLELHAQGAAGAAIQFDVLRNRFIGSECCGGEFASTVMLDLQGGAVTANVAENLMHRRAGGSTTLHLGVFQSNSHPAFSGNVYVTNNTFDDAAEPGNSLDTSYDSPPLPRHEGYVAGIYTSIDRSDFLHIYDNVFSYLENDFYGDPSGIADVKNNDFFAIATPLWQMLPQASAQLSVDPRYVSYALDFHLQSDSPLIDAGTSAPGSSQSSDLDGKPRLVGDHIDIGAYEYAPPTPPPNEGGAGGETASAGASDTAGEAGTPPSGGAPGNGGGAGRAGAAGTGAAGASMGGTSTGMGGTSASTGGTGTAHPGMGGTSAAHAGMGGTSAAGAGGSAGSGQGGTSAGCAVRGGAAAEPGLLLLGLVGALFGRRWRRRPSVSKR